MPGFEKWRISKNAIMSVADIAQHLVDADIWLFEKLENHKLEPIIGKAVQLLLMREVNLIQ